MAPFVATFIRGLRARLDATGGPPPGGLPIAYIAAGSAVHMTGSAPALSAGGAMGVRYISVPATQPLERIVADLNALQPPLLAGYPSMLARLAVERRAGRLDISPFMISATSELLTPEVRELVRGAFGVPIVNGFACTEGLVGSSLPDQEAITFAEDCCIVELVDEDNRPVPVGTPSAKVLVTHLSNRVQPLIRYELNDQFVALPPAAEHGYLRATVAGRADAAFRYADADVHPLAIRSVLVQTPSVLEYQVRQSSRGVDVDLIIDGPEPDLSELGDRLAAALAQAGLADPVATARVVPALERPADTGKVRRFVPLG
jgi:phenylacetate-coenzyme A ligase PaaK-like adenylate-forming protein